MAKNKKTQQEGFEPPEPCGSSAFEADAISQLDHCCKQIQYTTKGRAGASVRRLFLGG